MGKLSFVLGLVGGRNPATNNLPLLTPWLQCRLKNWQPLTGFKALLVSHRCDNGLLLIMEQMLNFFILKPWKGQNLPFMARRFSPFLQSQSLAFCCFRVVPCLGKCSHSLFIFLPSHGTEKDPSRVSVWIQCCSGWGSAFICVAPSSPLCVSCSWPKSLSLARASKI